MKYTVLRYDKVESTNTIALRLATEGCADATIVMADQQSAGKGRLSRVFHSPVGGLYMSAVIRPEIPPDKISLITLAAGVACADALEEICGLHIQLKWPNDLYVGGRKLGGLLTESGPFFHSENKIPFVVVGIGINVNTRSCSFSPELRDYVTSLYYVQHHEYDIEQIMNTIMDRFCALIPLLKDAQEDIFAAWRKRDYLLGKELVWHRTQGGEVRGRGYGMMADGRYRVVTSEGNVVPVLAGDLTVCPVSE